MASICRSIVCALFVAIILYAVLCLWCKRSSIYGIMKGAYARVYEGGTLVAFPASQGPLVASYRNPADVLDLQELCDRIDGVRENFAADIKQHVIRPCYLLDPDTTSTIYGLCSKHSLFTKIPYDGTGNCPMNRLLLMLMLPEDEYDPNVVAAPDAIKAVIDAAADNPSDATISAMERLNAKCNAAGRLFRKLYTIRDSIVRLIDSSIPPPPPVQPGQQPPPPPQSKYKIEEMLDVSQGDAQRGGKTYQYLDANGNTHQNPVNLNYPQAVYNYKSPTKLIVKSNGVRANQPYDPFNSRVFDNDAARLWFGNNESAYRTLNVQYVRQKRIANGKVWMGRDPADKVKSKKPSDQIADVIPAGSVRCTIMLVIECWLDFGQGTVSENELLDMISYLTILPGIGNSFADSTHDGPYNGAVGNKYRFTPAVAALLGITPPQDDDSSDDDL